MRGDAKEISKPNFFIESGYNDSIVAGVDEAGRGPWAGPVVAAAVIFIDQKSAPLGLNDSKKLKPQQREDLFDKIMTTAQVGVGVVSEKIIDDINILQATFRAMNEAVLSLPVVPDVALIDGNRAPTISGVSMLQPVVKGDARSLSIAAASIIAKVTRDRIMMEMHNQYPDYGWDSNAGYGTKKHQLALQRYGVTPFHRLSYKPIKAINNSPSVVEV